GGGTRVFGLWCLSSGRNGRYELERLCTRHIRGKRQAWRADSDRCGYCDRRLPDQGRAPRQLPPVDGQIPTGVQLVGTALAVVAAGRRVPAGIKHFQQKCEAVLRGRTRENKEMERFPDSVSTGTALAFSQRSKTAIINAVCVKDLILPAYTDYDPQ